MPIIAVFRRALPDAKTVLSIFEVSDMRTGSASLAE